MNLLPDTDEEPLDFASFQILTVKRERHPLLPGGAWWTIRAIRIDSGGMLQEKHRYGMGATFSEAIEKLANECERETL